MLLKLQIITQANERYVCVCMYVCTCVYVCMYESGYVHVYVYACLHMCDPKWICGESPLITYFLLSEFSPARCFFVLYFNFSQLLYFIIYTIFRLIFFNFDTSQSNPTSSGNVR